MNRLTSAATLCVAVPFAAFGIQHFIYGQFVTRVAPDLPSWIPWHPLWAYATGVSLIILAAMMATGRQARLACAILSAGLIVSAVFLHLPIAMSDHGLGGHWTNLGKALFMAASALLVARTLPFDTNPRHRGSAIDKYLDTMFPAAHYFLAGFFIVCGIQHFLFSTFVATLIPKWIPGPMFWTYFAGVALIAGGLGILVPFTRQLAATLSAVMVGIWVFVLHIPRALADLSNSNETTAVFEAACVTAAMTLVAIIARSEARASDSLWEMAFVSENHQSARAADV